VLSEKEALAKHAEDLEQQLAELAATSHAQETRIMQLASQLQAQRQGSFSSNTTSSSSSTLSASSTPTPFVDVPDSSDVELETRPLMSPLGLSMTTSLFPNATPKKAASVEGILRRIVDAGLYESYLIYIFATILQLPPSRQPW